MVRLGDAKTYMVTPDSSPSLQEVMTMTRAGDVVELGNGVYTGGIKSWTSGTENNPITVTGSRDAVISGTNPDDDRVITIKHSYFHLRGFTVDGKMGSGDSLEFYADKCIYVHGQEKPKTINYKGHEFLSTINGLVLSNLSIKNCQGECVRIRYFVTHSDIQDNDVLNCGVDDFIFNPGQGKNGEGIYIGTSSNQWADGKNPDSRPDGSSFNLIRNNIILTNGNECVEVKEGTEHNIIEGNTCGGQLDADSGCFGSRGDLNVFRFNKASECDGVGVRVGGHLEYGINNKVYENSFTKMGAGLVKIMAEPQAEICGNLFVYGVDWDEPCPPNIGSDLYPYGGVEGGGENGGSVPQDDDITIPHENDEITTESWDDYSSTSESSDGNSQGNDDNWTKGDDGSGEDDNNGQGDDDGAEGDDDSGEGDDDGAEGDDDSGDGNDDGAEGDDDSGEGDDDGAEGDDDSGASDDDGAEDGRGSTMKSSTLRRRPNN
ncbi:unnamed protein product [Choristocarpus tenellus]